MKRSVVLVSLVLAILGMGCSNAEVELGNKGSYNADPVQYEQKAEETLNEELAGLMEILDNESRALDGSDVEAYLAGFDKKYGTDLLGEFGAELGAGRGGNAAGNDTEKPLDEKVPFSVDGAVYLSGGSTALLGKGITFCTPQFSKGGYYHGAVLDLEKMDPSNLDARCLQTALAKGADYETLREWKTKTNIAVLHPNESEIGASKMAKLDESQAWMHDYCAADSEIPQKYGFFENTINVFKITKKEDLYNWYCTKVVWKVYENIGVDLDTNDPRIDFTTSGIYKVIRGFYGGVYFWSSSKADKKAKDFMRGVQDRLVESDEMYLHEGLTPVYERVQVPMPNRTFVRTVPGSTYIEG